VLSRQTSINQDLSYLLAYSISDNSNDNKQN